MLDPALRRAVVDREDENARLADHQEEIARRVSDVVVIEDRVMVNPHRHSLGAGRVVRLSLPRRLAPAGILTPVLVEATMAS